MIKAVMKLGRKGIYLNIIMAISNKPIANIIPNGKTLKLLPLKLRIRQRCPLFLFLFNIGLEFLAKATKQGEVKGIQAGKKEVKLFLLSSTQSCT
jgi:hypothetical protein